MTTADPAPVSSRPIGREEVMAEIIDAAADLFASKGPAATSIREVASQAGVNHGLVYRHFGPKDALVAAVLDALSDQHVSVGDDDAPANDRHLRVLARTILDGYPVGRLQRRFPTVDRLVEMARLGQHDEVAARLAAGHAVALVLGWQLFEPFLLSATGLDTFPSASARQSARETAGRLLRS